MKILQPKTLVAAALLSSATVTAGGKQITEEANRTLNETLETAAEVVSPLIKGAQKIAQTKEAQELKEQLASKADEVKEAASPVVQGASDMIRQGKDKAEEMVEKGKAALEEHAANGAWKEKERIEERIVKIGETIQEARRELSDKQDQLQRAQKKLREAQAALYSREQIEGTVTQEGLLDKVEETAEGVRDVVINAAAGLRDKTQDGIATAKQLITAAPAKISASLRETMEGAREKHANSRVEEAAKREQDELAKLKEVRDKIFQTDQEMAQTLHQTHGAKAALAEAQRINSLIKSSH